MKSVVFIPNEYFTTEGVVMGHSSTIAEVKAEYDRLTQLCEEQGRALLYVCPDCGGDGKETCHNPDHGFISAMSFHDIGRLGCPCCGHDLKGKVPNGGACDTCKGRGYVNHSTATDFIDGADIELEIYTAESTLTRHAEEKALMAAQMAGLDAELSQARGCGRPAVPTANHYAAGNEEPHPRRSRRAAREGVARLDNSFCTGCLVAESRKHRQVARPQR